MSMTFSGWPRANAAELPACPVSVLAVAYPPRTAAAIAGYEMLPAQPPLPTAWNFPFQPAVGIQTSILMSESLVGFTVAALRQNEAISANGDGAFPRPPRPAAAPRPRPSPRSAAGGVNAPAATVCALVMVTFGSARAPRLSQGAEAANVRTS